MEREGQHKSPLTREGLARLAQVNPGVSVRIIGGRRYLSIGANEFEGFRAEGSVRRVFTSPPKNPKKRI